MFLNINFLFSGLFHLFYYRIFRVILQLIVQFYVPLHTKKKITQWIFTI